MASRISHGKRGAERAARQNPPHPDDQALLLKQKHQLLQVRERGHLAAQRRPDLGPWRGGPTPPPWAEGVRPRWQEAPHQRARALDRLHVAPLLGACGGGWPAPEPRHDLQGPARRGGAARRQRAREKRQQQQQQQRAAVRGEKRRQEDLVPLRPRPLKSRRTAVGGEKKGAGRVVGLPQLAPGPPEKNRGKRGASRRSHRPDPRVRGDLDVGMLWAAAGGVVLLGDRDKDGGGAPGGRRSPVRMAAARLAPGPQHDHHRLGPYPQGQADSLERGGRPSCERGSLPPACPCPRQRREGSKWKRELESVFRELFSTNRKLKTHLNLYLESEPGTDTCPSREQGLAEACGCRRERRAGEAALLEPGPGPAEPAARPAAPSANLKELLHKLKDRQYRRMVEPLLEDAGDLAPRCQDEGPLWGGLRSRHEPPRPGARSPSPPAPGVGRAGAVAALAAGWPKPSPEPRWRPQRVEVLEVPQLSWEALLPVAERSEETETTETEAGAPTRAHARAAGGLSSPRPEKAARGCARSPSPRPAAAAASSEEEEEDEDLREPSQIVQELQEQILEQSRSHQQFLEQARRRLQEFQNVC